MLREHEVTHEYEEYHDLFSMMDSNENALIDAMQSDDGFSAFDAWACVELEADAVEAESDEELQLIEVTVQKIAKKQAQAKSLTTGNSEDSIKFTKSELSKIGAQARREVRAARKEREAAQKYYDRRNKKSGYWGRPMTLDLNDREGRYLLALSMTAAKRLLVTWRTKTEEDVNDIAQYAAVRVWMSSSTLVAQACWSEPGSKAYINARKQVARNTYRCVRFLRDQAIQKVVKRRNDIDLSFEELTTLFPTQYGKDFDDGAWEVVPEAVIDRCQIDNVLRDKALKQSIAKVRETLAITHVTVQGIPAGEYYDKVQERTFNGQVLVTMFDALTGTYPEQFSDPRLMPGYSKLSEDAKSTAVKYHGFRSVNDLVSTGLFGTKRRRSALYIYRQLLKEMLLTCAKCGLGGKAEFRAWYEDKREENGYPVINWKQ